MQAKRDDVCPGGEELTPTDNSAKTVLNHLWENKGICHFHISEFPKIENLTSAVYFSQFVCRLQIVYLQHVSMSYCKYTRINDFSVYLINNKT